MAIIDLVPRIASASLKRELLVVMPIYNESANIRDVLNDWKAAFKTHHVNAGFLLLNDGSRDETWSVLQELEANDPEHLVIVDKLNGGHGITCRLGYEIAVRSESQWILQIDSDGQCDPCFFTDFWEKRDSADCIFGTRVQRDDGFLRMLTSKICRIGSSLVSGVDLEDANVPYRMLRREVLASALPKVPSSFNIHNVALTSVLRQNPELRWKRVPIHFRERKGGENSIDVLKVAYWGAAMLFELLQMRVSKK